MKSFILILFFLGFPLCSSYGQDPTGIAHLLSASELAIQNELDSYLNKPHLDGLQGDLFVPFIKPRQDYCPIPVDFFGPNLFAPKKKTHYEVLFIGQFNNFDKFSQVQKPFSPSSSDDSQIKFFFSPVTMTDNYDFKHLVSYANRVRQDEDASLADINLKTDAGKSDFLEAMVHVIPILGVKMTGKELAQKSAAIIGEAYPDEEARYSFLASLAQRLNQNYNEARNPTFNNSTFNPNHVKMYPGNITGVDIFKGAADFNLLEGGVCNDISQVIVDIGQYLFKDKDVLTINTGTHFGVIISDGKKTRLIDGGSQNIQQNGLELIKDSTVTNIRIGKVIDGKLQEIAVLDSETGEVVEKTFQTGKKLLKSSPDINIAIEQFKKIKELANSRRETSINVSESKLSNSKVYMVVAKYETMTNDGTSNDIGIGSSFHRFNESDKNDYALHLKMGHDQNLIHYVSPSVQVNVNSGVHAGLMISGKTLKFKQSGNTSFDAAYDLNWVNKADAHYQAPEGLNISGEVLVDHAYGYKSAGDMTGALDNGNFGHFMSSMRFHLNQVDANVSVGKKQMSGNVQYQGSPVGQSLGGQFNFQVLNQKGAQILYFVGYKNSNIAGYKTQHSFLDKTQDGVRIGGSWKSKNVELGTSIIRNQKTYISPSIRINLNSSKK
jgi:hypothetical protein